MTLSRKRQQCGPTFLKCCCMVLLVLVLLQYLRGRGSLEFLFLVFAVWTPKTLNVSQLGSSLHVAFDQAPPSFGFHFYYLYYKLRPDGPSKLQRCKPVRSAVFNTF